ncbi:MAG: Ig-like domain-containing protein [Verrucomicrobiales bacterium]
MVDFGEPLDRALLLSRVGVEAGDGRVVPGEIRLEQGESLWIFTPETAWVPGEYRLAAAGLLEDLAGNSLASPFEVSFEGSSREGAPGMFYLPFHPRE